MPYIELLKKAFTTVRREPALWVLGIILALFGGGSSGGGSSGGNFNTGSGDFGNMDQLPNGQDFVPPSWFNETNLITIGLVILCVALLFGILAFVIRSVAFAGLIQGADRAATGEDVHWRNLWRAGWSRAGRRIMGMDLLLALPGLLVGLIFLIVLVVVGIPILQPIIAQRDPDPTFFGSVIALVGLVACVILIASLGGWILGLIRNYAARSIVLEGRPIMESLSAGWRLFRRHLADSMVFSIMLGVIGVIIGFVTGLLFLFIIFGLGLPLLLFWGSQGYDPLLALVLGVPAILLVAILSSLIAGPLLAFFETAWTVAWRHLTTPPEIQPTPTEVPLL